MKTAIMRYFLLLTLFSLLLTTVTSRPSHIEERKESEAEHSEYEGNEDQSEADEDSQDEDDSRLNGQDAIDLNEENEQQSRELVKVGRDGYRQRAAEADSERSGRDDSDSFSEYSRSKAKDEAAQMARELSSLPKRRQSNRYIDNTDVNDPPENVHLTNYRTNRVQGDALNNDISKHTVDSHVSYFEDSDSLFESNRENTNDRDKAEHNNEAVDPNAQARHLKQYYNTIQSDRGGLLVDRNYESRDRRQAEQGDYANLSSTSTEKNSVDVTNEEDEAAIKRQIRKLSGEELEELLNSLSEDKKALLNKIMEGDSTYDTVNKREITKKAGAMEENSFIDSGFSEISKVQGGPTVDVNTDSTISQIPDLENNKQPESQTETADITITKSSETTRAQNSENKGELRRQIDDANNKLQTDVKINTFDPSSDFNAQFAKMENKREINLDYIRNAEGSFDDTRISDNYLNAKDTDDSFIDQDHVFSQEDDLAQLMDEEALLHDSNDRQFKREASESREGIDDSIKSLEESFPNSNCDENGQYIESNMAPLVRVKRKDEELALKKRAAFDSSVSKVAYFPYKAENDDEDNEEGGEFDDEGFFDRTSNYAKNIADKPSDDVVALNNPLRSAQTELSKKETNDQNDAKPEESSNDKIDGDTRSLGSDTDSVLSGIEGVDDNLMFHSGNRNRRELDGDAEENPDNEQNRPLRSTPMLLDEVKPLANFVNLPNYQENDAFGPLPRNEGELGRFKRIRRVKSSPSSDDTPAGK